MSERWFRWYDGTMRDGKMLLVAHECEEAVATVVGIWASLLEDAATSKPRGVATRGIKHHSMWLGISDHIIGTAWNALERVGAIRIDGDRIEILNWNKRQFETDAKDPTSKNRKEKWKNKNNGLANTRRSGTERNGLERSGTPESESESYIKDSSLRSEEWPSDHKERFWQAYPRKVGKGGALRKLEAVRKSGEVSFARLLAAVGKIEASEERFIPHPTTWLNQGRYLDGPVEQTGPPQSYRPDDRALPSAQELRERYAQRREAASVAAEGSEVLAGSVPVCEQQANGVGLDRTGNRAVHSVGEILSGTGVGAVRDPSNPQRRDQGHDHAD